MSLLNLTTPRLLLTRLTVADAEFICKLTTDPEWLKQIGDRGVTDITSAISYIENAHLAMYSKYGVGLLKVTEVDSQQPVGVCGLMQRNAYDLPDLGYALLPEFRGKGYATEACQSVVDWCLEQQYQFLFAKVLPSNSSSIHVLEKLGFSYQYPEHDAGEILHIYQRSFNQC